MKQLIKKVRQIAILLFVISLIGCDDNEVEYPKVLSDFTYTTNEDTGTVTFINTSVNSKNYFWTFGDETSSTEINPVNTYTETGSYIVSLKATNVAGASNTFQDTIAILIKEAMTLPATFDNAAVKYDAATFGGAAFEIADNPDVSETNEASKVGAITNSGAEWEGINFDLGTPIDFTTDKTITMNFWADASVDVLVKLEEGIGANIEVVASHGGTGWETISFDFNSSDKYSRLTLFIDGSGTTAGTYYIDDIMQSETPPPTCTDTMLELPIDFDCSGIDYASKIVGDVSFTIVDNLELSGINATASMVGQITNTGNNWENAFFNLDTPVDFTTEKGIKLKLYSTQALPIKLKFEEGDVNAEADADHGGTGWEELTFNFTSTDQFSDMIIFVDGPGVAAGTFYIDDIEQIAGDGGGSATEPTEPAPTPTQDAANVISVYSDAYTDISGTDFNPGWGQTTVFSEVPVAGNNTMLYTGLNYQGIVLGSPQDVSGKEFLHLDYWTANSTALNAFLISTGPVESAKVIAVPTSGWASVDIPLTDFSSVNLADAIQLKFDGNGDIYLDNIYFHGNAGGGTCTETTLEFPIDFDCSGIDYASKATRSTATFSVVDNPYKTGANTADSKVGQFINDNAEGWENILFELDTPVDFATDKTIKLKLYSTVATTIKLKFEGPGATEVDADHGGSGWEELSFDFTSSDSYNDMVLFVDGPGSTAGTFYVDDIEQVATDGGGGGDCPAPPAGDLISNGDFEAGESCWQLIDNGGSVTISSSVSSGSGSKSAQIQTAPTKNPGVKQERFAAGTALANTEYIVTFDIKADASTPLVDGAVFQAFVFSEGVDGGTTGAVQHVLVQGLGTVSTSWETKTYTFISGAAPANVEGGFSFLAELVCGGAATCDGMINIDNVSITLK